jgi:DNA-binding LytR/AlgR family response regulator
MIKGLIADDERLPREQLADALASAWPELNIVGQAANGEEALRLWQEHQPAVAFLDIRMPGMSGLEVARSIAGKAHVVFLTAYDQHAVEAFDAGATDYLLKPLDEDRLAIAVQRLKARLQSPPADLSAVLERLLSKPDTPRLKWIQASVGTALQFVSVDDVLYFQSDEKYTVVRTRDGEAIIRTSLKELAEQLDPELFWQLHRGTLVAAKAIERAERTALGHLRVKVRGLDVWLEVSRGQTYRFKGM